MIIQTYIIYHIEYHISYNMHNPVEIVLKVHQLQNNLLAAKALGQSDAGRCDGCPLKKRQKIKWKNHEEPFHPIIPTQSMVYLPAFTIKIAKCRCMYVPIH